MPKTIPLVSELEWKVIDLNHLQFLNNTASRPYIQTFAAKTLMCLYGLEDESAYFTESCRQKLLAAMDAYGNVEEPEHWKVVLEATKYVASDYAKCLLELRQRIESLEGKK